MDNLRKYTAEFLGTFALVFCGTGAIMIDGFTRGAVTHLGISLVFGLIVLAMIYAIGDISGAHINPAVSFGFWVSGRFPFRLMIFYIISQLLGATFASLVLKLIFPLSASLGETIPRIPWKEAFLFEAIITFFLMFVVINIATGAKLKGVTAGVAVGAIVGLATLFVGPLTGASMNPARSFGPAIISEHLLHLWIYLTAPLVGSSLAVTAYKIIKGEER